jgi:hypothetical protein
MVTHQSLEREPIQESSEVLLMRRALGEKLEETSPLHAPIA